MRSPPAAHAVPVMNAALEGNLEHFFPGEVLQFLQLAQAHGRLELERGSERAEVYFERAAHRIVRSLDSRA